MGKSFSGVSKGVAASKKNANDYFWFIVKENKKMKLLFFCLRCMTIVIIFQFGSQESSASAERNMLKAKFRSHCSITS